jgi:hypothetical protein
MFFYNVGIYPKEAVKGWSYSILSLQDGWKNENKKWILLKLQEGYEPNIATNTLFTLICHHFQLSVGVAVSL